MSRQGEEMISPQFDNNAHVYTLNGRFYPSVTQVIKHFGMVNYSFVDPAVLKRSALFGTVVHQTTALLDQGSLASYDSRIEPWMCGYRMFLSDFCPEFLLIEEPMVSGVWGFAGTPDRVYTKNGKIGIYDIKTGSEQEATALQTAAYQMLIEENIPDFKIRERFSLFISPNNYKIIPYKEPADLNTFKGLVNALNWKLRRGLTNQEELCKQN
jgi:hypothetical protein